MISIYALINPVDDSVFYIGASKEPYVRLSFHVKDGENIKSDKAKKIKQITDLGLEPELMILEECADNKARFYEQFYMDLFRSWGYDLRQIKISTYSVQKKKLDKETLVYRKKICDTRLIRGINKLADHYFMSPVEVVDLMIHIGLRNALDKKKEIEEYRKIK